MAISFASVALIAVVAVLAPLAIGATGLGLPAMVFEILLGIVIPSRSFCSRSGAPDSFCRP